MATIKGIRIEEGMVIDFEAFPAEYKGVTIPVSVATVDYVEPADELGGPGLWAQPKGSELNLYIEIDESRQYTILG